MKYKNRATIKNMYSDKEETFTFTDSIQTKDYMILDIEEISTLIGRQIKALEENKNFDTSNKLNIQEKVQEILRNEMSKIEFLIALEVIEYVDNN